MRKEINKDFHFGLLKNLKEIFKISFLKIFYQKLYILHIKLSKDLQLTINLVSFRFLIYF